MLEENNPETCLPDSERRAFEIVVSHYRNQLERLWNQNASLVAALAEALVGQSQGVTFKPSLQEPSGISTSDIPSHEEQVALADAISSITKQYNENIPEQSGVSAIKQSPSFGFDRVTDSINRTYGLDPGVGQRAVDARNDSKAVEVAARIAQKHSLWAEVTYDYVNGYSFLWSRNIEMQDALMLSISTTDLESGNGEIFLKAALENWTKGFERMEGGEES